MMTPAPIDGWTLSGTSFDMTTSDGVVLRGRTAGSGPPVVFAHCWACDHSIWEPVAARLAGHRQVVLFDLRDHGRSGHASGETATSIERLGTDILEVIDALKLDRPVIAGHSMGGMAALAAAIEDDGAIAGLTLVATSAHPGGWPRGGARLLRMLARVVGSPRLQRGLEGRLGRVLVRGSLGRRPHPQAVERTRATFAATDPDLRRRYLEAIAAFDGADRVESLTMPVDVIAGSLDILLPLPHTRRLGERLPHARLTRLPGAGHMLPLERADAVADLIDSHLAARTAAPTESSSV